VEDTRRCCGVVEVLAVEDTRRCCQPTTPATIPHTHHTYTSLRAHTTEDTTHECTTNAPQGKKTRQRRRSARQSPHRLGAMLMGATWCPHTYRRESKREAAMTQHTAQVSGNHPPHRTRCSHVLGYMPACLHVQAPSACLHACLCMPPSHSPHLTPPISSLGVAINPIHSPLSTTTTHSFRKRAQL